MFPLTITTVTKQLFAGEARSVTLPGSAGELTVLKNHEPLITTLKEGIVIVRRDGEGDQTFPIERGLLEVSRAGAVVIM